MFLNRIDQRMVDKSYWDVISKYKVQLLTLHNINHSAIVET